MGGYNGTVTQLEIELNEYINKFSNLLIYYDNLYIANQDSANVTIDFTNFKTYNSNGNLGSGITFHGYSNTNAVESFGLFMINSVCLDLQFYPATRCTHTQEYNNVIVYNDVTNINMQNTENIINLEVYFYNSSMRYTSLKSCNIKIYGQR